MLYNVKVTSYGNEVQLNFYSTYIARKDEVKSEVSKSYIDVYQFPDTACKQLSAADVKNNQIRSRRRSKQVIYDICRANRWDYFATFTFEKDRFDYEKCRKRLRTFLHNFSNRRTHIEYIAVPEQHRDGAWHFHALIQGDVSAYLDKAWNASKLRFISYRYGLNEVEEVRDTKRVSMYITKYITKELQAVLGGRHRYFASKRLFRGNENFYGVAADTNVIDFIQSNFPDYDITYTSTCSMGEGNVKYIQLKRGDTK